ncbi:MAG: type II toxin-antitoxin system HipA family toxin [Phycisphaerales bacterium]|jgi:serine/threonine-protein kinase HipA|nr:type II toxin-antitoxin system HipA family toxin [Phycisphaerales bacterium]
MPTTAEVKLWGSTIGAVVLADGKQAASFQYDSNFAQSGIQVSPLTMPLSQRTYSFGALAQESFHGLPGLLADSLPDRFGNALINAWLARQGRTPDSLNAVERLCYTGSRGMGALEFAPAAGPEPTNNALLQVDQLVKLASKILAHRDELQTSFTEDDNAEALTDILRIGTSAGGARAKAVIAWNPKTNEVRSGQVEAEKGFECWLMKFDGVSNNRDKELADPQGYGAIEYAYSKMVRDCGITMSDCRLFEEGGRRHFMTRRFDRPGGDGKLHMQSLAAIAHLDFNQAGAHSYEQAFNAMARLGLGADATSELFGRMVFNIIARNQDDHVKNIAFLMDRNGGWSLAPAFDVTYSYQPQGRWTSSHQMTINGKRDNFTLADFHACGKSALLKQGQAKTILHKVRDVVSRWPDYADQAGVKPDQRDKIHKTLRLTPFE